MIAGFIVLRFDVVLLLFEGTRRRYYIIVRTAIEKRKKTILCLCIQTDDNNDYGRNSIL